MLESYLPRINTSIIPNRHHDNIFSGKLVNELHDWIENHPNAINPPNTSDSLFVKINGTIVRKQKHIIQISVRDLQNEIIFPIYQEYCLGKRNDHGKVCIGDAYLKKYRPKNMKPISNINNITCGCKKCISAMLIQSDLNKWR